MTYHRRGALGDTAAGSAGDPNAVALTTTAADFDSTRIPGTCKPRSFPVLNLVQELQRQLNRVAHVRGLTKTAVDGDIGPGTMKLFGQVRVVAAGKVGPLDMSDASSCMAVAPDIDVLMPQVRDFADSLSAPTTVAGPITIKTPSIVAPNGTLVPKPGAGLLASIGELPSAHKVVLLSAVGGIIYLVATAPKRRRRRS